MPYLQNHHIEKLQPLIEPFERSSRKSVERDLLTGEKHSEGFEDFIHDGCENNTPPQFVQLTDQELIDNNIEKGGKFPPKCFLWVIDELSLKMIWEKTPNLLRSESRPDRPYVCHTNITGCKKAYIGGEMYFCENGNIYLNFSSDRYGFPETEEKKQMAVQYIEDCGYKNIIRTDENF